MEEDIEVKRSFLWEETFVILVFFSQERLLKEKPSGKYLAGIVHSYVQMQLFFPQYDTVGDAELMLKIFLKSDDCQTHIFEMRNMNAQI